MKMTKLENDQNGRWLTRRTASYELTHDSLTGLELYTPNNLKHWTILFGDSLWYSWNGSGSWMVKKQEMEIYLDWLHYLQMKYSRKIHYLHFSLSMYLAKSLFSITPPAKPNLGTCATGDSGLCTDESGAKRANTGGSHPPPSRVSVVFRLPFIAIPLPASHPLTPGPWEHKCWQVDWVFLA